jgi:hypothetical protein
MTTFAMTKPHNHSKWSAVKCPLCSQTSSNDVKHQQVQNRRFQHCQHCDLIFVLNEDHPSPAEEKKRYQAHRNEPLDLGYREFLQKFIGPLRPFLEKFQITEALDYGCGPGPVLAKLLKEISIGQYDPYFYADAALLTKKYELVMATEVVEHFRQVNEEFAKLFGLVKRPGLLSLMTQFHEGPKKFSTWWYARDPTHLCFYSEKTFRFLAERQNLEILYLRAPVAIFLINENSVSVTG